MTSEIVATFSQSVGPPPGEQVRKAGDHEQTDSLRERQGQELEIRPCQGQVT